MGFQRVSGYLRRISTSFSGFQRFLSKKKIFLNFTLYYKTRQRLLQNAAALLDDHFITKRGKGSYKTRQLWYYKTRQWLLQNAAGITKRGKGSYKTRQVLQNAAIITKRGSTPRTHISLDAKFWPNREWLHF